MKQILLFVLLLLFASAQAQSVYKTMLRLPDTGQTTSYTNTVGEDADYTNNSPFYELNGDGTVLDTVTGLMWQQTDGGEMTFESAVIYCDTLTLGGYSDWRLPDCHELFSILNHDKTNPAEDTTYFSKTTAEYWWSKQKQVNDSNKVWVANAGGGVGNHPKSETLSAGGSKRFHVRAVRDITPSPLLANHFALNIDSTVTDLLTDLTWQSASLTDSLTWEDALSFADTLTYAGFTDWRLPNIKELQSINDEKLINPSVNQSFFPGVNTTRYWSSTSLPNQPAKAWYLDTHFGITTYAAKTSKQMVLCVRNTNFTTHLKSVTATVYDLLIYPNPSNGEFIIDLRDKSNVIIRIFDFKGVQVYQSQQTSSTLLYINAATLLSGMYVIEVISGLNKGIGKLIIN